jgi:septal ring factor EnvC (AmiA/AmiB activator)
MIMASEHDGFAEWRGTIESRVTTLESTVKTEASVRAAMDKDMSDLKTEFRAQRSLLQALADTQSEHTEMLRDHTKMLQSHGERLTHLEAGVADLQAGVADLKTQVADLRTGLATVGVGVQTIIGLLDREIEAEPGTGASPE